MRKLRCYFFGHSFIKENGITYCEVCGITLKDAIKKAQEEKNK